MMLTDIPPRLLHRVRDTAAVVHGLAQLGLELLCPCEDGHRGQLPELGHDADECAQHRPAGQVHRFTNGVTCWCGAEHWRIHRGLPGGPTWKGTA